MLPSPPENPFEPTRPRDAAAVVLARGEPDRREVFWVRRARGPAFAGFHAFPGGSVDRSDDDLAIVGLAADEARLFCAAVREVFEETGVLLARLQPGRDLAAARRDLLEGRQGFAGILRSLGAGLDASLLSPAGRWLTPPFAPKRFDARFYFAELPHGQQASVVPGELERGEWIAPSEALKRWDRGEALLHPPALHVLRTLARNAPDWRKRLCRAPHVTGFIARRIELQRGVHLLPLLTPTLPPARHTTCYLVGDGEMVVVDPGSPYPGEQAQLLELASGLVAEGRRIVAIVLTHHHPDHVLGVGVLKAALGVPVWAHRHTADHVEGVDRLLDDGEVIPLEGARPMRLVALHTPGHAPGHLCLFEPESRALLCGDMLSGASTIVIDPPEGDMESYLAALDRLESLGVRTIFPAHGETLPDGPDQIAEAISHRRWREDRVLAALERGPAPLAALTRQAYDELPEIALPFAERSALASLIWLERRGRVLMEGEHFRLP